MELGDPNQLEGPAAERYERRLAQLVEQQRRDLARLRPPAELEDEVAEAFRASRRLERAIERLNEDRPGSAAEFERAEQDLKAATRRVGWTACVSE